MTRLLLVTICFTAINCAAAIDSKDLIINCEEYIAIYNHHDKERLLAAISTSPAEAMRAGICRGVLEEHSRHEHYNCDDNWYQQAQYIAEQDPETYRYSFETLLDNACEYRAK